MPKGPSATRVRTRRSAETSETPTPARAKKISITVDETVLGEVRAIIRGTGRSLSAHVSEALARDLRRRKLGAIIAAFEADQGTIGDDELAVVRRRWQG